MAAGHPDVALDEGNEIPDDQARASALADGQARRLREVVAIEVKFSRSAADPDVAHLLWLRDKLGDQISDLVVLNTGEHAYRRADGVAVVPLDRLGAWPSGRHLRPLRRTGPCPEANLAV